jgi:hypothetical protein
VSAAAFGRIKRAAAHGKRVTATFRVKARRPPRDHAHGHADGEADLGGELNLRVCAVAGSPSAMTRSGSSLLCPTAIEELDGRRFVFYGLGDRRAGLAELERA